MTGRYIKRYATDRAALPAAWTTTQDAPAAPAVVVATHWTLHELRKTLETLGATPNEASALIRRLKMRRGWGTDNLGQLLEKLVDTRLSLTHEVSVIYWTSTDDGAPLISLTPEGPATVGHWRHEDGMVLEDHPERGKTWATGRGLYVKPVIPESETS
uniref:hypothetical protein n=1 Tax=Nonomuraea sp. CA-251285 TaxID=3240002 RepID=UPI003F495182